MRAYIKGAAAAALALVVLSGVLSAAASSLPVKAAVKTGVTVYANDKASIDASNLSEGYVMVKYTGGKKVRVKVQITKTGTTLNYSYDLNNAGTEESFPLTEGNGDYDVKVFENTTGDKYAQAHSATVKLSLRSEFLPYLYPNQFVNFNADSSPVAKAAELMKNKGSDLERVAAVFDYVVTNISYDYDLAKTVKSGYVPNIETTYSTQKGICFDYAALMASMLRSQGLPCKLVIGYAGTTYHAWLNVYITGTGWVDGIIYFDGVKWSIMDPTFLSTGKGSDSAKKFVTTGSNYTQKFAY